LSHKQLFIGTPVETIPVDFLAHFAGRDMAAHEVLGLAVLREREVRLAQTAALTVVIEDDRA
jgi:hypothetical protein